MGRNALKGCLIVGVLLAGGMVHASPFPADEEPSYTEQQCKEWEGRWPEIKTAFKTFEKNKSVLPANFPSYQWTCRFEENFKERDDQQDKAMEKFISDYNDFALSPIQKVIRASKVLGSKSCARLSHDEIADFGMRAAAVLRWRIDFELKSVAQWKEERKYEVYTPLLFLILDLEHQARLLGAVADTEIDRKVIKLLEEQMDFYLQKLKKDHDFRYTDRIFVHLSQWLEMMGKSSDLEGLLTKLALAKCFRVDLQFKGTVDQPNQDELSHIEGASSSHSGEYIRFKTPGEEKIIGKGPQSFTNSVEMVEEGVDFDTATWLNYDACAPEPWVDFGIERAGASQINRAGIIFDGAFEGVAEKVHMEQLGHMSVFRKHPLQNLNEIFLNSILPGDYTDRSNSEGPAIYHGEFKVTLTHTPDRLPDLTGRIGR